MKYNLLEPTIPFPIPPFPLPPGDDDDDWD